MSTNYRNEIIAYLKKEIAAVIKSNPDDIDESMNFLKLGISSIQTIMIINRLKQKLAIEISPVAMFEYKNISALSNYISDSFSINDMELSVEYA